MTDFEHRLRAALTAVVEDAEPPRAVMDLVRRRYRRQNLRLLAGLITIAVLAASAALAVVEAKHRTAPVNRGPAPAPLLFPGGGRILFAQRGSLYWLYPDGRRVPIATGFTGAVVSGRRILAFKSAQTTYIGPGMYPGSPGTSYYSMNLNGSGSTLVLPPESSDRYFDANVQLSPDGSRLAYLRLRNGELGGELFSINLATRQRSDLGPGAAFLWKGNTAIVDSVGRTLDLVNVSTGSRSAYLTLSDRRLIRADQQASPRSFAPTSIWPDSWEPGGNPAVLAVGLAWQNSYYSGRVEALIEPNRDLAFAPQSTSVLSVIWGRNGIFMLESGGGMMSTNMVQFGSTASRHLSAPYVYFQDAALFNPSGTVAALEDSGIVSFVRVPRPGCHQVEQCPRYPLSQLVGRGEILAWAPAGPAS
jgi:hypothetical protein